MVEDEVRPFKKAKLEKSDRSIIFNLPYRIVKRVTFDLPAITENELKPSSPQGHTSGFLVELKQTKEFGSLPIIGKAQRSFYSYMLTMKMEQQLEQKFSSLLLCIVKDTHLDL
jgi:hypothetical protein